MAYFDCYSQFVDSVFQGRPGHMIPFMGLQAFDFCASALFVFGVFSYLPYLRSWLLSLVRFVQKS